MWAVVRSLVGIFLVLFIMAILVSPYVDLPLTTVGAQQVALWFVGTVAMAAVAAISRDVHCTLVRTWEKYFVLSVHDRGRLDLTCALLC